jgi:hypothetical protein
MASCGVWIHYLVKIISIPYNLTALIVSTLLVIKSSIVVVLTELRSIYLHLKVGKTSHIQQQYRLVVVV